MGFRRFRVLEGQFGAQSSIRIRQRDSSVRCGGLVV